MGGVWASCGAPLHGVVWGSCFLLLSLPAASLCQLPSRSTRKKKSLWANQDRCFFFTDDEMSKWSSMFLFALACHFIHFKLFNHI